MLATATKYARRTMEDPKPSEKEMERAWMAKMAELGILFQK